MPVIAEWRDRGHHPVACYHGYEKGRVFVTTSGHTVEIYRDPQYLAYRMSGVYGSAIGPGQRD